MTETITRPIPRGAIRIPLPNTFQQKSWTCGPAAVRAICEYYGCGPDTERQFKRQMSVPYAGADPEHLMWGFVQYGLDFKAYNPMTIEEVKREVRRGRPVLMMLQAWGTNSRTKDWRRSYEHIWQDGHWVVAIGYDREGMYFEDPSILKDRGFLDYAELKLRWHDHGPRKERIYNFGISVWRNGKGRRPRERAYVKRCMRIM